MHVLRIQSSNIDTFALIEKRAFLIEYVRWSVSYIVLRTKQGYSLPLYKCEESNVEFVPRTPLYLVNS